jgi:hypothetical protein
MGWRLEDNIKPVGNLVQIAGRLTARKRRVRTFHLNENTIKKNQQHNTWNDEATHRFPAKILLGSASYLCKDSNEQNISRTKHVMLFLSCVSCSTRNISCHDHPNSVQLPTPAKHPCRPFSAHLSSRTQTFRLIEHPSGSYY